MISLFAFVMRLCGVVESCACAFACCVVFGGVVHGGFGWVRVCEGVGSGDVVVCLNGVLGMGSANRTVESLDGLCRWWCSWMLAWKLLR